jgi:ABC-type Mn2+/Zn2+ transport system permease subunit
MKVLLVNGSPHKNGSTNRALQEIAEAIIGCTFVLSATLVILVLAGNPHGAEHINDILSGQLLFADWEKVLFAERSL